MDPTGKNPSLYSADEVIRVFETSEDGLSNQKAKERFRKYGPNRLEEAKKKSVIRLLIDQVTNPVIYLLIAAVIISLLFGDTPEAIAILVVIVMNTAIGFWMEYQAQVSVKALKKMDVLKVHVKRDHKIVELNSEDIVPGDVISIEAGDIVPADARIIQANEVTVDESALTGESLPVEKSSEVLEKEKPLAERSNMLFKGTALTGGKAQGIVIATGKDTEIGSISEMVTKSDEESVPLNQKLHKLSKQLIWVTVGLALLFFVFGWISGKSIYLLLQTAIAWTVAAIPEGLPIVASIALARGMIKLAKRNVVVKRLSAVETLGETTIIFTDKTGTLTENKLTLTRLEYPNAGLDTEQLLQNREASTNRSANEDNFQHLFRIAVFCNAVEKVENHFKGDPLDVSLMEFFSDYDGDQTDKLRRPEQIHEDPFDSESKFMGKIHKFDNQLYISCKGAAETVLSRSDFYLEKGEKKKISEKFKQQWQARNDELSGQGLKVIACAYRTENTSESSNLKEQDDFVNHMIFTGLFSFVDPAKKDVTDAIHKCHEAGIRVAMITGDHAGTAANIAQKVGLTETPEAKVLEGSDIRDKPESIYESNLFARVDPKQKHEIVDHFKEKGEIAAMTGDGVNDAPALKKADIGIAMGKRGTQLAQEVADIILKDDSFPAIVDAIEEGRIIFGNIRRFIMYQLSYHLAEILTIAGISFTLFYIPLLPLQLLFLNLLTDVFPALALGLGKGNAIILKQPPKDPNEAIITRRNWITTGIYGVIIAVAVTGAYLLTLFYFDQSKEVANTVAFFSLAFAQIVHVFNMREAKEGIFRNQITSNSYIWIAILICTTGLIAAYFIPLLRNTLSIETLSGIGWSTVAMASVFVLLITQGVKQLFNL